MTQHFTLTSELAHRAMALAKKTTGTEHQTLASTEPSSAPATLRRFRSDKFRPCKEELDAWRRYYSACAWYQNNPLHDSPFSLALPSACDEQDAVCNALASNKLILYFEACQAAEMDTKEGRQALEPRQFTERLR